MLADGLDEFWEVGPKGGLQSLLKSCRARQLVLA
jgi:hypothetical protein